MRALRFWAIISICWTIAHFNSAAHSNPVYPDLAIEHPFASVTARDNLAARFPELNNSSALNLLTRISRFKYSFSEPQPCDIPVFCEGLDPKDHLNDVSLVRRQLDVQLNDITGTLAATLQALEFDDGCNSMRFPQLGLLTSSDTTLLYTFQVRSAQQKCPFGAKIPVASGTAQVYLPINLVRTPPTLVGDWAPGSLSLAVGTPSIEIIEIKRRLPFFSTEALLETIRQRSSSELPAIMNAHIFRSVNDGFDSAINWVNTASFRSNIPFLIANSASKRKFGRRAKKYLEYLRQLAAGGPRQSLDVVNTKFVISGGSINFQIVYFAQVYPYDDLINYYPFKQLDIDFIRDLSKAPITISVARGDSFWRLAKRYYGVGDLWYLLAKENGVKDDRALALHPGQEVVVPPAWMLDYNQKCIVNLGMTVWEIQRTQYPNRPWDRDKLMPPVGSMSIDKVYPLQCLELAAP